MLQSLSERLEEIAGGLYEPADAGGGGGGR
jgi:hypothetical protein